MGNDDELESINGSLMSKEEILEYVGILKAPDWSIINAFDSNDIGKSLPQRMLHWGPMLTAFLNVAIGISTTIVFFNYWSPLESISGFINISIFLFLDLSSLVYLIQASKIGGGYVKKSWIPEDESFHRRLQYCSICKGYKAPRSHHCSLCNRCVLKMDHHCPWVNNCVGHRNHALFVKFCASAIIGCLHSFVILSKCVITTLYMLSNSDIKPIDSKLLPISDMNTFTIALTGMSLSSGVVVSVIPLLYIQLKAIYYNMTQIEQYIVAKAEVLREKYDPKFIYPYDLGWRRNVSEVLGNGTFPKGNGIWWPIRRDSTQFTFSEEQLDQKHKKLLHTRIGTIGRNYNGGRYLNALLFHGPIVFICQPLTDNRRVAVNIGEKWAITRQEKYWVYAKRVEEQQTFIDGYGITQKTFIESDPLARGWFPTTCLMATKDE